MATMSPERAHTPTRRDLGIGFVLALIAAAVFLNTLHGEFVYDDEKQIVENPYIQIPAYYGRALRSDVWAFRGGASSDRPRYWRPTLVTWFIANHAAFGLHEPAVGWHVGSIVLHAIVTLFGYLLLRRLLIPVALAAAAGLLFAVHPVHTETVAWISGSADLLLAVCLLGSLLVIGRGLSRADGGRVPLPLLAAAVALYAIAQGAKEVAIFHAVLVALFVVAVDPNDEGRTRRAVTTALPFAVVGVAYLVVRRVLLGPGSQYVWGDGQPMVLLTTAPALGAFYLRQMFIPIELGPSYPVRAVTDLEVTTFAVPALICLLAAAWGVYEWRRGPRARFLIALFVLILAPAGNIRAFMPEHIVHDRYLYVPLLGFLGVVVLTASHVLKRWIDHRANAAVLGAAIIVALPLAYRTWHYNRVWMNDLALWETGIESDPTSASARSQYAVFLLEADRPQDALASFDTAIEMRPGITNMYIGRADAHYTLRRYREARADLDTALEVSASSPGSFQRLPIYRRIARTYEAERLPRRAIETLREAAEEMSDRRAAITRDIAIMLVQDDRPGEALMTLESVRGNAVTEPSAEARQVLYLLGMLYRAVGNTSEARKVWNEFLDATSALSDPMTRQSRMNVERELREMPP
jgi:tetratricopeptide (TPR) repeat protein